MKLARALDARRRRKRSKVFVRNGYLSVLVKEYAKSAKVRAEFLEAARGIYGDI